jgi:hypothetical protein
MGADLLVMYVAVPFNKDIDELKAELLNKVKSIDLTAERENVKEFVLSAFGDEEMLEDDEESIRAVMLGTVEDFFGCLNNRDVSSFLHKGEVLYVTGGMSWGDSPTDSYDRFERFSYLDYAFKLMGNEDDKS